jgi:curved DNA-binding protein CbpA
MIHESQSLYDILDLKPDASQHEVREAYLRTKSAYNKDSVALYTLVGHDEREDMIKRIEEAYNVLSNPSRRHEYDKNHETYPFTAAAEAASGGLFDAPVDTPNVVSIDRVPPMETSANPDDLLIAPAMDYPETPAPAVAKAQPLATPSPSPAAPAIQGAPFQDEFAGETEWRGATLKKIREERKISIEEMVNITKVSKTYLLAIEDENYAKLPAAVFVRGFVAQMARILKLPQDQVSNAYMARYRKARPE